VRTALACAVSWLGPSRISAAVDDFCDALRTATMAGKEDTFVVA
jgi:hypothetical protein